MKLKVIGVRDPHLRKKSLEVSAVDKKIKSLVADLWDTLAAQKDPEGVGLAAPQVGKNLRIFVAIHEGEKRVVINPKVISIGKSEKQEKTKKKKQILEGCLSLPHYYGPLTRSKTIKLEYLNEDGKKITEEFTGFMAQIMQHEIDHLNGVLFVDRILEQKQPLYKFENDEWEEVDLV